MFRTKPSEETVTTTRRRLAALSTDADWDAASARGDPNRALPEPGAGAVGRHEAFRAKPEPGAGRHESLEGDWIVPPDGSPPEPGGEKDRPGWLPVALADARLSAGRRGFVIAAAVLLAAALVSGFFAWRGRPDAAVPVDTAAITAPSSAAGQGQVVVAVAGKVRRPGLVRLPAGSRVADALTAAGGLQPGVDTGTLNLARKLTDGELIAVGVAPAPVAGAPDQPGAKLDLNTATVQQLDGLPGVGPVLAQRIVDARQSKGGFRSVEDLRSVDGIGDTRYQRLKELVTV